ncbi:MAG: hypothetical protein ACK5NN_00310 [Sphingomonadaceae bacterium]
MSKGPVLSDHALLRFIERGLGHEIEVLRAALETALNRAHGAARSIGDSDYLVKIDGLTFVVRGETVTTVLHDISPGDRANSLARGQGKCR